MTFWYFHLDSAFQTDIVWVGRGRSLNSIPRKSCEGLPRFVVNVLTEAHKKAYYT